MRTTAGVTFLIGDHQNTAQLTIDAADHTKISRRRTTPFGQERDGATGSWPLAMDKGFVGGTNDNTGLTHLSAREYDPNTGRFISVDPLLYMADQQQMNGYTYANNSPTTLSDPAGLDPWGCAAGNPSCAGLYKADENHTPAKKHKSTSSSSKPKPPVAPPDIQHWVCEIAGCAQS